MLFASQKPIRPYEEFMSSSKTKIKKLRNRSFLRKIITQLSILRTLHRELSSAITQITGFFSQELKRMGPLLMNPLSSHKVNLVEELMTFRNKKDSMEESNRLDSRKYRFQQTSAIKERISQEFTELKVLEQRSNYLRMTNQQLMSRRKSLSNSKTNQSKEKLEFTPKERLKDNINDDSHHRFGNYPPIQLNHSVKIIHPSNNSKPCLEISKSLFSLPIPKQNSIKYPSGIVKPFKSASLQCSQGHDYYIGETQHNIPHGIGNLVRCCSHFPMKLSQKISQYSGSFEDGKFEGSGVLKLKGGIRFEGSFKAGMRHGKGTIYIGSMGEQGYWQYDMLRV